MKFSRTNLLPPFSVSKKTEKINPVDSDYLTRRGLEIYISHEVNATGETLLSVREHYVQQDAEVIEKVRIKSKFGEYLDKANAAAMKNRSMGKDED